MWFSYCNCFIVSYCILAYFYHVFYRITVIGWSALAVVSRYCQILLLLLLLLLNRMLSYWTADESAHFRYC